MSKYTEKQGVLQGRLISWQNNVHQNHIDRTMPLKEAVEIIRGGSDLLRYQVLAVTDLYPTDKPQYSVRKSSLPAFIFPGVFEVRNNDSCKSGSGLGIADLDEIEERDIEEVRTILTSDPYAALVFLSPSGAGFKIVYHIQQTVDNEDYRRCGETYSVHLERLVGHLCKVDAGANKDIARACFISYDPAIHLNYDADMWIPPPKLSPNIITSETEPKYPPLVLDDLIGMDLHNTDLLWAIGSLINIGFDPDAVNSYIIDHVDQIMPNSADRLNIPKLKKDLNKIIPKIQYRPPDLPPPSFSNDLLSRLPLKFKKVLDLYPSIEIKGDILPSLFIFIGFMVREWSINVPGEIRRPSFQLWVLGDSGVGKSHTLDAAGLLQSLKIETKRICMEEQNNFRQAEKKYKVKFHQWKKQWQDDIDNAPEPPNEPNKPPDRRIIIDGDITKASFVKLIQDNPGGFIMMDSEAETVTTSNRRFNHGGFKDIEKKTYDHEPIQQNRATTELNYSSESSFLSIIRSGTPNQLKVDFASAESGVFARFDFQYVSKKAIKYRKLPAIKQQLAEIGTELISMFNSHEPCIFEPTQEQLDQLSLYAHELEAEYLPDYSGTDGVMTRTAIRVLRMAMVLQLTENPRAKVITNDILDLAIEIDKVLQEMRFKWAMLYLDNPVASYSHDEVIRQKVKQVDLLRKTRKLTVENACEEIEISTSAYYRNKKKSPK